MMQAPTWTVALDDGTEHTVVVLTVDQLRAELEAGQLGLPLAFDAAPTHHTALWLWAALVRTGVTDEKFKTFQNHLRMVRRLDVEDPDTPPADQPVDPTHQGQDTTAP
jgi:hypothetical protein